jgi:hypothetical protein
MVLDRPQDATRLVTYGAQTGHILTFRSRFRATAVKPSAAYCRSMGICHGHSIQGIPATTIAHFMVIGGHQGSYGFKEDGRGRD